MKIKNKKVHLEIQPSGDRFRGVLRSTSRKNGKVVHETCGHIPPGDFSTLKLVQAALQGKVVLKTSDHALKIKKSKEYGASHAFLQLARDIGLDKAIYSRPSEQWVKDCLAMIIGRLVYSGSKRAVSQTGDDSALWELCGVEGAVDVDTHCYASMDRLYERQEAIQKKLVKKHLTNGSLVLYDITRTYFEGEYDDSTVAAYGYSRDKKRGHQQMIIGLLCNEKGCPVSVEVFSGNTQDASTVPQKIEDIQKFYNVEDITFVGDRGMITRANYKKLKRRDGLHIISALTHRDDEEKIYSEQLLDGCYIITGDVPAEEMNADEIVESYKKLRHVETAFRNLKTVMLEIRPVYHKTDDRIKCHVFICMLAYYLEWHFLELMKPLFSANKKGTARRWTKNVIIERLKSIRQNTCVICGVESQLITESDGEQKKILDVMKKKM